MTKEEAYQSLAATLIYILYQQRMVDEGPWLEFAKEIHPEDGKTPYEDMNAASQVIWGADMVLPPSEAIKARLKGM